MAVAGVHFGNTNSSIAVCKGSKTDVVSNETGERVLPTLVGYTGSEKVVGIPAKNLCTRCPQSVINNIKFLIGTSHLEELVLQDAEKKCSCKVVVQKDSPHFQVQFDDSAVVVNPTEAATFVLTKLLENAESVGGSDLEDTVLTVPVWFTEKQRIELSEACEDTGFNVLRVISEPSAALLAYGIGQDDPSASSTVLVYRLGGSSVDATIVEVNSGMYRITASKVDHNLGGNSFDEVLVDTFTQEFYRKWKLDLKESRRSLRKLKAAAEQCKCVLSSINNTTCSVDSLHEGIDFHGEITRAKFESLAADIFNKVYDVVACLLKESKIDESDVNQVILVGGSTRMPKIRQLFTERFPNAEILSHMKPEEVICIGAAKEAAIIQGKEEIDFADLSCPVECLAKNISLEVDQGGPVSFQTIVKKYTPVPFRKSHSFQVEGDRSSNNSNSYWATVRQEIEPSGFVKHETLRFNFYETSSDKMSQKNEKHLIAKVLLHDVKKGAKIVAVLEMTRECSLNIAVTDEEQKRTESVNIELASH